MANIMIRSFLRPAGMKNKGNTCFFNATIQSLLSLPSFISYFKRNEFLRKKQPLSYALKEFIYDYQNGSLIDPQEFIRSIRPSIKLFDGRQQDAHCFLIVFLSTLMEEQGEPSHSPAPALRNMFRIVNEDTVTCHECDYSNIVQTEMNDRYLFVCGSVGQSLRSYMERRDAVDSRCPWICPKCKTSNAVTIGHQIKETSEYFIVHLNRFTGVNRKNNASITVDEGLEIEGTAYENVGVICHVGNLQAGHYFAKAKRDSAWYVFNDSSATRTERTFEADTPYILLYARAAEK